jgi:hypothetical protein
MVFSQDFLQFIKIGLTQNASKNTSWPEVGDRAMWYCVVDISNRGRTNGVNVQQTNINKQIEEFYHTFIETSIREKKRVAFYNEKYFYEEAFIEFRQ